MMGNGGRNEREGRKQSDLSRRCRVFVQDKERREKKKGEEIRDQIVLHEFCWYSLDFPFDVTRSHISFPFFCFVTYFLPLFNLIIIFFFCFFLLNPKKEVRDCIDLLQL